ncbi:MAG: UDP-N-acetylmuramate dehydrogenase [Chloroflexi bacterium]|nr:UDP-N-acetylmuramate dehydrogenase [Chloroflexota bacterium]
MTGTTSIELDPRVKRGESLARHTSLRVGGPARLYFEGDAAAACAEVLRSAVRDDIPVLTIGGGSNLLIADEGFDGLVVKYTASGYEMVNGDDGAVVVTVASGVPLGSLARRLARTGVGGLEWAATVPGTVGGGAVNNAGAFGGCLADHILDLELIDCNGALQTLSAADLDYAYRTSVLKRGERGAVLVTRIRLALQRTDAAAATARIVTHQTHRSATQPRQLSAGSIFANPPGDYSGRLIEAAGLKGARIGGAEISGQHANFIVNTGGATAADVYGLIQAAQAAVWERFDIWLRPEVQLVGAWAPEAVAALARPAS